MPEQAPWQIEREQRLAALDWAAATRFWPLFPTNCVDRLDYWRQLAPVYLAAFNEAHAGDGFKVTATVDAWPQTEAEHQAALRALLTTGKLRQAWRVQRSSRPAVREEWEALEAVHREGSRPLAEIPLYSGMIRCACQQLVCLPLEQWRALDDPAVPYRPETVASAIVAALAARIARAFNAPPQDAERARECCGVDGDPIVWSTSLRGFTEPIDGHGMAVTDDGPLGEHFGGYYGCLRITLGEGEEWRMAVLAPNHFIDRLIWLGEEAARPATDSHGAKENS
jgi:hypothetical protein